MKVELLRRCLFVMFALLMLGHLSLVLIFGEVRHYEPNLIILITEICLSIGVVLLAFKGWLNWIKGNKP